MLAYRSFGASWRGYRAALTASFERLSPGHHMASDPLHQYYGHDYYTFERLLKVGNLK